MMTINNIVKITRYRVEVLKFLRILYSFLESIILLESIFCSFFFSFSSQALSR